MLFPNSLFCEPKQALRLVTDMSDGITMYALVKLRQIFYMGYIQIAAPTWPSGKNIDWIFS